MVGANQYIYKRELQFWSFFPVMLFMAWRERRIFPLS